MQKDLRLALDYEPRDIAVLYRVLPEMAPGAEINPRRP
jgi:hypothetical protein